MTIGAITSSKVGTEQAKHMSQIRGAPATQTQ
jgi:hypothetical protein